MNTQIREYPVFDNSYMIFNTLGRGKNSTVYKARKLLPREVEERKSNPFVALKVINTADDPDYCLSQLKREALAMLGSKHPNVVELYNFVSSGDNFYITMECADRGDLRQVVIDRINPLDPEVILRLMMQALDGITAIHKAGIIHRDIKPENMVLTMGNTLKITDFGIALLPNEKISEKEAKLGIGTFDYLAPETLERGVISRLTDIYSLGVSMYELLTNHLPFEKESIALKIDSKMKGKFEPISSYVENPNPYIEKILAKAMAPDPYDRFKGAAEFKEAITNYLSGKMRTAYFERLSSRSSIIKLTEEEVYENYIKASSLKSGKFAVGF